jgi:hypothetical protein
MLIFVAGFITGFIVGSIFALWIMIQYYHWLMLAWFVLNGGRDHERINE